MSRYFAELDADSIVLRVIVCDDPDWIDTRLGGTWAETADPYIAPGTVAYTGPGHGHDPEFPQRFAPPWVQPVATDEGWTSYPVGQQRFHLGRIWRSGVSDNVWEPGSAAWLDAPPGGIPTWHQPTGSADAWPATDPDTDQTTRVTSDGRFWANTHGNGNVWEPGATGIGDTIWREVAADGTPLVTGPAVEAWQPWDGTSTKYQRGAEVTHDGQTWTSTHPGQNTWSPNVYGWVVSEGDG